MPRPAADPRRLLLLLPTATYRTAAFVEAARRLGVDLTVASERPSTFQAANPTGLVTLDFSRPDVAAQQARAFARAHPLAGVVGVDDDTAVVAAAIAEALRVPGNTVSAAEAARDKHEQRTRLAAAQVPVPRFALHQVDEDPRRFAGRVPYPCVVKPLRLSASRGVIRADTPAQFVAAFERVRRLLATPEVVACGEAARRILVEEFVPGREYALEGLLIDGALRVLALFDKPDPLDGPYFEETIYVTPSRLPNGAQRALAECVERAARALGLTQGPVHAELRHNEPGGGGGPWLIELAARPIGGRCSAVLRFEADISLEEIIIRHALGMPIPTLERERQAAGVMMIPVPRAGVLREVRGIEIARAVPLVDAIEITAHPGEVLVPWPEGSRYPGFIFARGKTPEAVEQALRAAHLQLQFVFDPTD